jgi:hypothetical protein
VDILGGFGPPDPGSIPGGSVVILKYTPACVEYVIQQKFQLALILAER